MGAHETKRVVEAWIAAMNAHDPDAYLALLADDVEQVTPTEQLTGRAAADVDIRDTFASQPDVTTTVLTSVVADGVAAVEYRMSGTLAGDIHVADGRVVASTGRRYDMEGCSLVWVRDGRISAIHHDWDRVRMREQLGL